MVRPKSQRPSQVDAASDMEVVKCKSCELALNRNGENRPGIRCKECKLEYCPKCAELPIDFCRMATQMGKDVWGCSNCEKKTSVMKSVLEKIDTLHTEMVDIKKGQEGQQAEQERVLEGIKVVETVVKRMEAIEKTQVEHGERLLEQEVTTRKNTEKIVDTEKRTLAIEKKLESIDSDAVGVKQINAVVRELRDIENSRKNLVICNLPESSKEEAEERKKHDEQQVGEVFKQLKADDIKPRNVIRVGHRGRYPKKLLVILKSEEESEKILGNAEKTELPNDIWLTRDRTYNQREGARLFHAEKKDQEGTDAAISQRGKPNGSGRGPGRPKKNENEKRKRQRSGEEDDSKWRRTGESGRGRGAGKGGGGKGGGTGRGGVGIGGVGRGGGGRKGLPLSKDDGASPSRQPHNDLPNELPNLPTPVRSPTQGTETPEAASTKQLQKSSDRQGTPRPISEAELGAAGGSEVNF